MAQPVHLSTQEIAELAGKSRRWVERKATDFNCVEGEGGTRGRPGRLFDLATLPPDVQRAWAEQQRQKVVAIGPAGAAAAGQLSLALALPEGPNLSEADRAEAERRFGVIEPLVSPDKYAGLWAHYGSKGALVEFLCGQHQVARRTLYNWLAAWRDRGLPGLVTKDRSDKGRPKVLNAAALDYLVAASLPKQGAYGQLSVKEIFRAYREERTWRAAHVGKVPGEFERRKYARYLDSEGRLTAEALLPEVSYECMRQWIDRVPEAMRTLARDGDERYSARHDILSYRDLAAIQPLDYVVMDHRRLDLFAMVRDNRGWKLIRPWLTAAIDMRTRKWLAWVIVETPSSDSIVSVLKRCFMTYGLPVSVYWDNGKDFRCHWLEGRQERTGQAAAVGELPPMMRGALQMLDIRVHHAIVKRARSKIIEPNFLATALYDKSTPWWCGNKPTTRPEGFSKLVDQHEAWLRNERSEPAFPTIEEIAADYDDLLQQLNQQEREGAEGMRIPRAERMGWMSPDECWEREITKVQVRTVPDSVLHMTFAKRKTLTVRHGAISMTFHGQEFHYRMIGNSNALVMYDGREVQLGYDPLDLGTAAAYYEDVFIGLVECVDLRRMGEDAFVQDERDRRAARRVLKQAIAAAHRSVYVAGQRERSLRRQAVEPVRPVVLPPAIVAAATAKAADEELSCSPPPEVAPLPVSSPSVADEEGEFCFFKEA